MRTTLALVPMSIQGFNEHKSKNILCCATRLSFVDAVRLSSCDTRLFWYADQDDEKDGERITWGCAGQFAIMRGCVGALQNP
jgi:hypothetical protein